MLSQQQTDVLQEIANIGMGQAGEAIAKVLNEYVVLSIPRVHIVPPSELIATLERTLGTGPLSAVRQTFHGPTRGEAIAMFNEARCNDVADLMGYAPPLDRASEIELLLDISNMLISGCLNGIATQLETPMGFSAPSLLAEHLPVRVLVANGKASWESAILVDVHFNLRVRAFACNIVMLIPGDELEAFAQALDTYSKPYR